MAVEIGAWLLIPRRMCLSLADLREMLSAPPETPELLFEVGAKEEALCVPRRWLLTRDPAHWGSRDNRNDSPVKKKRGKNRKPKKRCPNALYLKKSIEKPFLTSREVKIDVQDYLEQQAPSEEIVWTPIEDGDGPYTDDDE